MRILGKEIKFGDHVKVTRQDGKSRTGVFFDFDDACDTYTGKDTLCIREDGTGIHFSICVPEIESIETATSN